MKFPARITVGTAVLGIAALTSGVLAQSSGAATPLAARDYAFTISTAQPWTDTGVDLQAGETLAVTAIAPSEEGCDPAGVGGSTSGSGGLPVLNAPAGALIARLGAQDVPMLVGSSRQLKVDAPGHLYFGINAQGAPPCKGSFAVKVHAAGAENTQPPLSSDALTPSSSQAAGSSAAQNPAQPTIKSKLASAAQVFLAGQFGTGSAPSSSAPQAGNNVAASDAAPASSAAAAPAPMLNVSGTPLASDLQKDLASLPRRVNDQFNNQGDMVNFVLVGSEQQVQSALTAANWRVADTDNKEAVLKAVLETYQKKDYLQMPMSQLYLFGRKQDYGYELAEAYSVVASRHHFRIWKAPFTWNGQSVWAGAGTHDIGFEKDQRNGSVTHKIDPAVDGERDNIGSTLQKSGKAKSLSYYLPPDPVQGAKNATGGGYHSDGRILVVQLQ
jgi:hypothetical protein